MPSRNARSSHLSVRLTVGLLVLLVGIWLGGHPSWLPSPLRNALVDEGNGRLVDEALGLLSRDYYRPVSPTQLLNEGIAAAVASLHDPYSHYYDPAAYRAFLEQTNPHLSGIGIDVMPDPRGLRVVGVFPGSPAARAGLTHGDVIVRVGTIALQNRSADFASRLIKGPPGTRVTLTVVSGAHKRVISITRANLVVPVASGSVVNFRGIAIGDLHLTSFTDGSGAELRRLVKRTLRSGARALILDLRENGGGLLDEAVTAGSTFIPDGTIVSTAGRNQPRQVYLAKGGAISTTIPMVVLVDHGTASAAEIVTGALRDRGRAKVVGTRTYGKGVFQEIQPLSNGGALDITVGEYFTPNGQNLGGGGVREGGGIQPSVYALDNPHTRQDEALRVAERTIAAEVR
jgi:carboxyl-terminal processing protease